MCDGLLRKGGSLLGLVVSRAGARSLWGKPGEVREGTMSPVRRRRVVQVRAVCGGRSKWTLRPILERPTGTGEAPEFRGSRGQEPAPGGWGGVLLDGKLWKTGTRLLLLQLSAEQTKGREVATRRPRRGSCTLTSHSAPRLEVTPSACSPQSLICVPRKQMNIHSGMLLGGREPKTGTRSVH